MAVVEVGGEVFAGDAIDVQIPEGVPRSLLPV
jgi:hypothetical protein